MSHSNAKDRFYPRNDSRISVSNGIESLLARLQPPVRVSGSDDFSDAAQPCTMTPPQDETLVSLGEEAVCGIHYESYNNGTCSKEYRLKSYPSREQAETAGAFVTHAGACGACSTTQDLASYLRSPDLTYRRIVLCEI